MALFPKYCKQSATTGSRSSIPDPLLDLHELTAKIFAASVDKDLSYDDIEPMAKEKISALKHKATEFSDKQEALSKIRL